MQSHCHQISTLHTLLGKNKYHVRSIFILEMITIFYTSKENKVGCGFFHANKKLQLVAAKYNNLNSIFQDQLIN